MTFFILLSVNVLLFCIWHFTTRNVRNADDAQGRAFGFFFTLFAALVIDIVTGLVAFVRHLLA